MPEEMGKFESYIRQKGVGAKDKVGNSLKSYLSYLESAEKYSGVKINENTLKSKQDVNNICNLCKKSGGVSGKTIQNYKSALNKYVEMVNSKYEISNVTGSLLSDVVKDVPVNVKNDANLKVSKSIFNLPKPVTLNGRSSSITNSLINGVVPVIAPSDNEILLALDKLGMDTETICCAYCGDKHTEWDHLRPIIVNKMASGFITEIQNLVPACGKCNQSKGNSDWKDWIIGDAEKSPKSRNVKRLEERIKRLDEYCQWKDPTKIDFELIVGSDDWTSYIKSYEDVIEMLDRCNEKAKAIKKKIKEMLANSR